MNERTIDCIFDYIEYLCLKEDFRTVDVILYTLEYHKYSNDELISYLTITLPFKKKLRHRGYFAYIVRERIQEKTNNIKETDNILKGLI